MTFLDNLEYFGDFSTLHGVRFVFGKNNNYIQRSIWTLILIISGYNSWTIFLGAFISFREDSISFATETTWIHWNTEFASVAICESWYRNKFWDALERLGVEDQMQRSQVQEFLSEVVFFNGRCYTCVEMDKCPDCRQFLNFTKASNMFRKSCPKLLKRCSWNGSPFECCKFFRPIPTEFGVCYAINSKHDRTGPLLDLTSNRTTGSGHLNVVVAGEDVVVHMSAPEDVPFINADSNLRERVVTGRDLEVVYSVVDIANDDEVVDVDVERRNCLFPQEVPDGLRAYEQYSYSTCIVQCRIEWQLKFCNCTHHFMPGVDPSKFCDLTGIMCLAGYYDTLNRIKAADTLDKVGLVCDCLPSCIEPDFNIIMKSNKLWSNKNESNIDIKLHALPSQKFKRDVIRKPMDLIVSIGGTIGLCFGASVLSLIEIIYIFFVRK